MQRIDTFLVEHQFVESREQAKRLILAGAVTVNGNSNIKPGQRVPGDAKVVVQEQQKYVSRGGFKLEKALSAFDVDVQDRVALDVGASTGGFTDCLLQHGVRFVYAVDVGYGQFAWKLRTHPQVLLIERTNVRYLTQSHLKTASLRDNENFVSIVVVDVSFISLRTVLPSVIALLTQQETDVETDYDIIALLKPQFEAGKSHVKKGGVVSDKQVHIQTINNLCAFVRQELGAAVMGLTYSPIHKDIANIEYLLWLKIDKSSKFEAFKHYMPSEQATVEVVEAAHRRKSSR
ncbi:MAG: TlyA family RNA methyltransferase [Candidatus Poribacteria bacterium]|nr:TlyA family RNA methyltransferase [Candidatus Poribacteria bacterium]